MKNYQIWIAVMIVFGAIAGSTFATVAHLQSRKSAPVTKTPASPQPTAAFLPFESPVVSPESPVVSPESPVVSPESSVALPEVAVSVTPTVNDFSPNPPPISPQTAQPTTPVQKSPQNIQPQASAFSQFRLRLLNATQRADSRFIRAIVTPQTQWNYGGTINLDSYKINNKQSKFWSRLEKAVSQGCSIDSQATVANKELGSEVWACPDLSRVKQSIQPDRPNTGNLAILGQDASVRAEPRSNGQVVGSVSYDYVSIDLSGYDTLPTRTQEQLKADVDKGWTPVQLRTGERGWIQNRYIYDEEKDYRVSFVRQSGQWRLRYFLPGNGN